MFLEDERRDCAGRRQARQPAETERFAMDPHRVAEPVHGDAQFGQRLFEHAAATVRPLDQHGTTGYAARQYGDDRFIALGEETGRGQVLTQRSRVFDIEGVGSHDTLKYSTTRNWIPGNSYEPFHLGDAWPLDRCD